MGEEFHSSARLRETQQAHWYGLGRIAPDSCHQKSPFGPPARSGFPGDVAQFQRVGGCQRWGPARGPTPTPGAEAVAELWWDTWQEVGLKPKRPGFQSAVSGRCALSLGP